MIGRDARSRGRWLLLVLVAHLAVAWFLLLATGRKATPAHTAEARPLLLVWLREPRPAPAAARPPPPPTPRRPPPTAVPGPHPPAATTPAEPISMPISLPADPTRALANPPSPAASVPAPLNLQLPRHWDASAPPPAALTHRDPRLGSPMNRSERFADQMGTDQTLVEETTATGRRLRRGNTCVELRPNRNGQLDPFNGSVRPAPSLASDCRENEVQQPSRSRRPPP